jgi:hypothetical protein
LNWRWFDWWFNRRLNWRFNRRWLYSGWLYRRRHYRRLDWRFNRWFFWLNIKPVEIALDIIRIRA